MDSLHAIGFYVSAALAGTGGLFLAFTDSRQRRAVALGLVGLGVAGIDLALSAGFAALVVLICYAGCALLAMRPDHRFLEQAASGPWRQAGAVGAALLLAVLAYAAFRGNFAHATFNGGPFGSVAVGRLLFAHHSLAAGAGGGFVLAALVGAAGALRRGRPPDGPGEGPPVTARLSPCC